MSQDLQARIGMLVLTKRREARVSQQLLSRRTGLPQSQISDIEHGRRVNPLDVKYTRSLRLIALALGLEDPRYFLQYYERPALTAAPGRMVRYERLMRGVTQEELAERWGVTQETVSTLERTPLYEPSNALAEKIAAWLREETR